MTERIIALDPGGTTGWAMWTNTELTEPGPDQFVCGQIAGDDHHQQLYNLLGNFQTSHFTVVTERFDYRAFSRAGLNLMSREYIGVSSLFYQERMMQLGDTQHYIKQTAGQAKPFVGDERIKALGLNKPGLSKAGYFKHAADAYRHLIYYIVNGTAMKDRAVRRWILETAYK